MLILGIHLLSKIFYKEFEIFLLFILFREKIKKLTGLGMRGAGVFCSESALNCCPQGSNFFFNMSRGFPKRAFFLPFSTR